jgi:divalent metal cation (Fe/Co/Zn/Cd) transporter
MQAAAGGAAGREAVLKKTRAARLAVGSNAALVLFKFVSRHLLGVARATDSVALAADAWHLRVDLYTFVAVLLGLLVVRFTG